MKQLKEFDPVEIIIRLYPSYFRIRAFNSNSIHRLDAWNYELG